VILACVVGEISRSPIGAWQSQEYRGEGVGTHHLLTHGMHSDYAVCCDGSDLNIVWTQTGVVQIKIATFSKAEAAGGTRRSEFLMEKVNAIVKMTKIIAALEVGDGVRGEIRLQFPHRSVVAQSQHRCDRGRSALST
jgi:hypothetical protein